MIGSIGERSEIGIGKAFNAKINLSIPPYCSFMAKRGNSYRPRLL